MSQEIFIRYINLTPNGLQIGRHEYRYIAPSNLDVPLLNTVVTIRTDPKRIGGFAYTNPALVVRIGDTVDAHINSHIVRYTGLTIPEFIKPSLDKLSQ